jgi:hypothetical protein
MKPTSCSLSLRSSASISAGWPQSDLLDRADPNRPSRCYSLGQIHAHAANPFAHGIPP